MQTRNTKLSPASSKLSLENHELMTLLLSIEKEMLISGSDDGLVYIWNKTTDFVPEINPR